MKLLSKDVLRDYGFIDNAEKSNVLIQVMSRKQFDVCIKDGTYFFYSNLGIDYPLKDLATLRKLYKEVKREDLNINTNK
jgi:hypothetical protein